MPGIEDLLRKRDELLKEIDREILESHMREATILFTDIVESTRFYATWGDIAGRHMVQVHNDLLFPIIASHGGRVIKTIGDSIMAMFDLPGPALAATVEMQRAMAEYREGRAESARFHVRMGLHCGRVVVDAADLFGDVVNTAARVQALAESDEIIFTGAVREGAGDCRVPAIDLGAEVLRGLDKAIALFLADWRGLGKDTIQHEWRERRASAAQETGTQRKVTRLVELSRFPDPAAELAADSPPLARGNPYLNRVMIPHPSQFVGRRAVLRRVLGRLGGSRPQSISIVGERRIGKSSLLARMKSPEARLTYLEVPERCFFAYIDLQQVAAIGPEHIVSIITAALRKQTGMRIEGPEDYDCLALVGETLAPAGARLVLLLDEFEAVTREKGLGPEFYGYLRSLANGFPISFVCASGKNLKELCTTKAIADSPFFNIFSQSRLGSFEPEDAFALIRDPSAERGLPLEPLASSIRSLGGLHPFFLQIALSAWFEFLEASGKSAEYFQGKPIPREVLEIFREEASPHFAFIRENFTDSEAALAGRLALAPDGATESEEEKEAANTLLAKGYVEKTEGAGLRLFSDEFARLLKCR